MKAQDLINILQQCDPDTPILVWNAYRDSEDGNVHVSHFKVNDGPQCVKCIHIGNMVFGEEIIS